MSYLNIRQKLNKLPKGDGGMTLEQLMEEQRKYTAFTGKPISVTSGTDAVTGWMLYKQAHPEIDEALNDYNTMLNDFGSESELQNFLTLSGQSVLEEPTINLTSDQLDPNKIDAATDIKPIKLLKPATMRTKLEGQVQQLMDEADDSPTGSRFDAFVDNALLKKFSLGGNNGESNLGTSIGNAAADALGNFGSLVGMKGSGAMLQGLKSIMGGNVKGGVAGLIGGAVTTGIGIADDVLLSDKNFNSTSDLIDTGVHTASSALMSTGNPFAVAAGAIIEGINFASKAAGTTVLGYDVNINSSGYDSSLLHMDSKSHRYKFGYAGGVDMNELDKELSERNTRMQMALRAMQIANTQHFQQEARSTNVDNIIRNNQIALAGGIDTSLLGA